MKKLTVLLVLTIIYITDLNAQPKWAASVAGVGRETSTSITANKHEICNAGNTQGSLLNYSGITLQAKHALVSFKTENYRKSAVLFCTSLQGDLISFNSFFGNGGEVKLNDIELTPNGTLYVAGNYNGQLNLPKKLSLKNTQYKTVNGLNGVDGFVAKYDKKKNLIWVKTLTNETGTQALQLHALEKKRGVIIQGNFNRQLHLNKDITIAGKASKNHYLIYLKGDGKMKWHQQWPLDHGAISLGGVTANNDYLYESLMYNTYNKTNKNANDAIIIKRDLTNGNEIWHKQFKGIGPDYITKPITDINDNVYAAISFQNSLNIVGSNQSFKPIGQSDLLLLSLNHDGEVKHYFQFEQEGYEMATELNWQANKNKMIVSYYQTTPQTNKIHYHCAVYNMDNEKMENVPVGDLLSRDFSIQSSVLIDNQLIYTGVIFKKKDHTYDASRKKIFSTAKSDIYLGVYELAK